VFKWDEAKYIVIGEGNYCKQSLSWARTIQLGFLLYVHVSLHAVTYLVTLEWFYHGGTPLSKCGAHSTIS